MGGAAGGGDVDSGGRSCALSGRSAGSGCNRATRATVGTVWLPIHLLAPKGLQRALMTGKHVPASVVARLVRCPMPGSGVDVKFIAPARVAATWTHKQTHTHTSVRNNLKHR